MINKAMWMIGAVEDAYLWETSYKVQNDKHNQSDGINLMEKIIHLKLLKFGRQKKGAPRTLAGYFKGEDKVDRFINGLARLKGKRD